jgi:hypothetical protein
MQIKKECSKAYTKYELAMYKFLITYCASRGVASMYSWAVGQKFPNDKKNFRIFHGI